MVDLDLPEFLTALSRLCAGFDVPMSEGRKDAYWLAFRKLTLREFERLVNAALSANFAKLPNVGALWKMQRDNFMAKPQSAAEEGPTLQSQLCEYAAQHVHDKDGPKGMTLLEYSRPWTYVYREWIDPAMKKKDTNPEGRCAECIGIVIELANGKRIGWSVKAMLEDVEGHMRAMRAFRPGPLPSQAQDEAWHTKVIQSSIPIAQCADLP